MPLSGALDKNGDPSSCINNNDTSSSISDLNEKAREEALPTATFKEASRQMNVSKQEFDTIVNDAKHAIANGILPVRIGKGSSGSYFVKNVQGTIVGVFKPRDEEPYSENNPNWKKFWQRLLFPCIFGRSCLIENSGYICEAGASFVDRTLGLKIVPRTEIIELSSPSFHYRKSIRKRFSSEFLPTKSGSFQLFVDEFKEATIILKQFDAYNLNSTQQKYPQNFLFEFQKMIILDYIIRNTDRGMDNWLIKYVKNGIEQPFTKNKCTIKLAAIDHGLAFPYKHPDKYRSYPYSWSFLPCAKFPFLDEIKEMFGSKLADIKIWEELEVGLKELFAKNCAFTEQLFEQQMSLMRGQLANLVSTMQANESPFDLIKKPMLIVKKQIIRSSRRERKKSGKNEKIRVRLKRMMIQQKACFTCC